MTEPHLYQEELDDFKIWIGALIDDERRIQGIDRWSLSARSGVNARTLRRVVRGDHLSLRALIAVLSSLGLEISITRKRRTETDRSSNYATTASSKQEPS